MALIHWEPVREISSLQDEMNRLFGRFFEAPGSAASGNGNGNGIAARRWLPAMDLVETDDHFVLRADLPGIDESDVNVELEDSVLTISGERSDQHERSEQGYHRLERASGSFRRSLTLPEGVDADRIEASFDRGVLEVRIPKPEQRKPRRVQISVGDTPRTIEGAETGEQGA